MDDNRIFIDKLTEMTGITFDTMQHVYKESGLSKHSEVRKLFMDKLQLSYGYANTLVHIVQGSDGKSGQRQRSVTST